MKTVNIVLFGVGNVGSTLIKQILADKEHFKEAGLELNIPVIVNSRLAFFQKDGINSFWESEFSTLGFPYKLEEILLQAAVSWKITSNWLRRASI